MFCGKILFDHKVWSQFSLKTCITVFCGTLYRFSKGSDLIMVKPPFYLVLIICVVKECNLPRCCDRCCHKEVGHCWRRAIFKTTVCHLVVTFSHGHKCSSSPVCHRVGTETCCDLVLKVSLVKNCSSPPVCHLVMPDYVTKVIFVMTRWQTDEEAHLSLSDTFKTRAQQG